MNRNEYVKQLTAIAKDDRELANAIDRIYRDNGSGLSWDQLVAHAEASLGRASGKIALGGAKNVSTLPAAFGLSEANMRQLVDPNSPTNWMTLPSREIQKAAIRAGYMDDLSPDASQERKQKNREGLATFLSLLSAETTAQGRRNAVAEYENTKFSEHPVDWARKGINDLLFRTTSNRMKEQAIKGQGPSSFGGMGAGDAAAILGDIGVNSMYGAGSAGLGRYLAARTPYGLISARQMLAAPAAAGAIGGAADALNRDINTETGARWYEYPSEAVLGAALNTVSEPVVVRNMIRNAGKFMKGAKVAGQGSRGALTAGQTAVDRELGMDEARVLDLLSGFDTPLRPASSPMSTETRGKIAEMGRILDDGMTKAPGEEASLFDKAQAMYERGAYTADGKTRTAKESDFIFMRNLDRKIDDLEGALTESAGANEAPAMRRELEYWKNLRQMRDNNLVDFEDYFFEKEPTAFSFTPKAEPGMPEFTLKPGGYTTDARDLRTLVMAANNRNVAREDIPAVIGMSEERYSDLLSRYPEVSEWMSGLRTYNDGGRTLPWGSDFMPAKGMATALLTQPKVAAKTGTEAILRGLGQPAATEAALSRYDRPDTSPDTIRMEYELLRSRKPEATDAAMNWKFDPRLPGDKQLDEAERTIVNKYRAMLLEEAMRGR